MMNSTWSHIVAATGLTLMALIIHLTIRADTNTKALDTLRYYTLKRVNGDVSAARALVESDDKWLSLACQAAQNKTSFSDACVVERKALRDAILTKMNCMQYNSQVCQYLRAVTAGILQTKTYGGTSYAVGRALSGTVPGQGSLTYRQLLWNTVNNAQYLFRGNFKAAQADDFYVLRTILYSLIVFVVLGNLLVHFFDQYSMTWSYRLATRVGVFVISTLLPAGLFTINATGTAFTALFWIWLPAFVVLFYFEIFLDATITRPWIHPYTFTIIYASLSVLALVENGVLNSLVVTMAIGQAHAVALLYMQIVWYWVGYNEKKTHSNQHHMDSTHAANLYLTREMQYALYLATVVIALIPTLQTVAPFDYDCSDLVIRGAPLAFVAISVWGTLFVQEMKLDERYGNDVQKETNPFGNGFQKERLVYSATRITGGKLAVSLLLLAFVTLFEFNLVGQYFRWLRAYSDKLPERAWQYDVATKYTIGTGFLPSPTLYL